MIIVGAECRSSSNSLRICCDGRGRGGGGGGGGGSGRVLARGGCTGGWVSGRACTGGWVCARPCGGAASGGRGRPAARPRAPSRIIVLAPWMSSRSPLGCVVWLLDSAENSFDASGIARIDTDVGLGWNGTSRSEE